MNTRYGPWEASQVVSIHALSSGLGVLSLGEYYLAAVGRDASGGGQRRSTYTSDGRHRTKGCEYTLYIFWSYCRVNISRRTLCKVLLYIFDVFFNKFVLYIFLSYSIVVVLHTVVLVLVLLFVLLIVVTTSAIAA